MKAHFSEPQKICHFNISGYSKMCQSANLSEKVRTKTCGQSAKPPKVSAQISYTPPG